MGAIIKSPKDCLTCGQQAQCKDSRHGNEYVRRRYHCECGQRWTTAEFRISDTDDKGEKVTTYLQREHKGAFNAAINRAIAKLQELL